MDLQNASIQELGHHIGLPVDVNLQGMSVGGEVFHEECWVSGVVIGLTEAAGQRGRTVTGTYLSIKLDTPVGDGESRGLLRRSGRGQDRVWVDSPQRVRPKPQADVPAEIIELARAGKRVQAIKEYRALTGATLDEAKVWLNSI